MKWMEFIDYSPQPVKRVVNIPVRQLGIQRVVVVRTKKNGGING